MKIIFELVAATNLTAFNELVNERLANGYKFVTGQPMLITPHEDISGNGYQYSIAMLKEEGEQ